MNGDIMQSRDANNDESQDMLFANIDMEGIQARMDLGVSFNQSAQLDHSVLSRDDED